MEPLEVERILPPSRSSKLPQYLATLGGTLIVFSAGTCKAWVIPVFKMGLDLKEVDANLVMYAIRLLLLGAILGALLAGLMLQRCGRRGTLLVLSTPLTASYALLLAFGTTLELEWLCFARVLAGIAMGGVFVTAPIYISEVAEDSIRGQLGSLFLVMFNGGRLLVHGLGLAGSYVLLNACCLVLSLLASAVLYWMPETPHHHLAHNRKQLARNALQWLRGHHYDVSQELDSLQAYVDEAAQVDGTCRNLVRPAASRALFTSLGLFTFQQLCGISIIGFFMSTSFSTASYMWIVSTENALTLSIMVVTSFVGSHLVDCLGRRLLLLVSGGIVTLLMGVLFISSCSIVVPLAAGLLYHIFFSVGFGPLPWTIMAELLPPRAKGLGASFCMCLHWLLAIIVSVAFQSLGYLFYSHFFYSDLFFLVFAAYYLLATLFVYFCVPETKGKSLRQIQEELAKRRTCLL